MKDSEIIDCVIEIARYCRDGFEHYEEHYKELCGLSFDEFIEKANRVNKKLIMLEEILELKD